MNIFRNMFWVWDQNLVFLSLELLHNFARDLITDFPRFYDKFFVQPSSKISITGKPGYEFQQEKIAGILLFVGSAQFIVALIFAESVFLGYGVFKNFMSDLGTWNQPFAFIFDSSPVLTGFCNIAGSCFVQRAFGMQGISALFILLRARSVVAGIFPENILMDNAIPVLHTIGAIIAFV